MSRPLRIEYPGAVYHVMNRALNQNLIFLDKKDYKIFLSTLDMQSSSDLTPLFEISSPTHMVIRVTIHFL